MIPLASQIHQTDDQGLDDRDDPTRVVSSPVLTLRDLLSIVFDQSSRVGEEWLDRPVVLSVQDRVGRTFVGRLASASVGRASRRGRLGAHQPVVVSLALSTQDPPRLAETGGAVEDEPAGHSADVDSTDELDLSGVQQGGDGDDGFDEAEDTQVTDTQDFALVAHNATRVAPRLRRSAASHGERRRRGWGRR